MQDIQSSSIGIVRPFGWNATSNGQRATNIYIICDISIYESDTNRTKHTESHKLSNIRKIHFLLTWKPNGQCPKITISIYILTYIKDLNIASFKTCGFIIDKLIFIQWSRSWTEPQVWNQDPLHTSSKSISIKLIFVIKFCVNDLWFVRWHSILLACAIWHILCSMFHVP